MSFPKLQEGSQRLSCYGCRPGTGEEARRHLHFGVLGKLTRSDRGDQVARSGVNPIELSFGARANTKRRCYSLYALSSASERWLSDTWTDLLRYHAWLLLRSGYS